AERQVESTLANDTRRLAKIFLHEARWAQMGPREAGCFEVVLDFLVHKAKGEGGIRPSVQTGEFDHVSNAGGLASIDKRALRFDHVPGGSRNHEGLIDPVQSRRQAAPAGHIAFDDFDSENVLEPLRLGSVPYQDSYGHPLFHEFVRYERTCRTSRACKKYHRNLLEFRSRANVGVVTQADHSSVKTGMAAETHRCLRSFFHTSDWLRDEQRARFHFIARSSIALGLETGPRAPAP